MQTVLKIMEVYDISPDKFFDFEYLTNEIDLEKQMIEIIKKQPINTKRIMYKILKQFEV